MNELQLGGSKRTQQHDQRSTIKTDLKRSLQFSQQPKALKKTLHTEMS